MFSRQDWKEYGVPVAGFLWGLAITMVAVIGRVQDISLSFPIRTLLLVAAPGYLLALGWLVVRSLRQ